ncbi:MAG TPA: hypothetical protein VFH34_04985 [Anaerolineales bacterium]|nr:hypothetical protein [Anaerolineales bacterium]
MAYTKLIPRFTSDAQVEEISQENRLKAYRLSIPAGTSDTYRLAQLDDYAKISRSRFPLRYHIQLSLSARASSGAIPGTWGFGLWNDPFGLSLGFGGNPFRLPTLPNAVWFFGASEESYLSFKSELRPERSEAQSRGSASTTGFDALASKPSAQRGVAANGFLAQTFRSPKFHPLLIPAGMALPFSRKATRRLMGKVIGEDGVRLSIDVTQWHHYQLNWREDQVSFAVDDAQIFESRVSPHPPLGLVIWIDNQYAAFTPDGKIGFGVLANPEPAWLEVKDIHVG